MNIILKTLNPQVITPVDASVEKQIEITVQFIDAEPAEAVVLEERKMGFPMEATQETIIAELKKALELFKEELQKKAESQAADAEQVRIAELLKPFEGGLIK